MHTLVYNFFIKMKCSFSYTEYNLEIGGKNSDIIAYDILPINYAIAALSCRFSVFIEAVSVLDAMSRED